MNPLPPALLHQGHFLSTFLLSISPPSIMKLLTKLLSLSLSLSRDSACFFFLFLSLLDDGQLNLIISSPDCGSLKGLSSNPLFVSCMEVAVSGWMEGRPTDRPHSHHPNPNTPSIHSRNNKRTHSALLSFSVAPRSRKN
jgi:hypothetical protein